MTTSTGVAVRRRPLLSSPALTALNQRRSRWLMAAAYAAIALSLGAMIVSSLDPASWMRVKLVTPGLGPPWQVSSLRLSTTFVTVLLWLAALAGAGGVAGGLAALRRGDRISARLLIATGVAATAILTVLPPAGSSDILDYATFGHIVTLGHSPYVWAPYHVRRLGGAFASQVPQAWVHHVTLYGPLATFEQFLAAVLGGSSMARVVFFLKLWNAIAFLAVAVIADRVLRDDPAARTRAHLLWTVNPLLLWGLIAGGHLDMIAAGAGLCGLLLLGRWRDRAGPALPRAIAAGFLLGVAADIKISYLLFAVGAAWALRRSRPALLAASCAGLAVLVPTYVWYGPPAVKAILGRTSKITPDNIYQLFSTQHGFVDRNLLVISLTAVVVLVVLALWRLPRAALGRSVPYPAVRPALALSLAWLFVWPYQLPWYDVMAVCLLIFYPASRLDWLVLTRLAAATLALIPGSNLLAGDSVIGEVAHQVVTFGTPLVLVGCVVWLVYLSVTGNWAGRDLVMVRHGT